MAGEWVVGVFTLGGVAIGSLMNLANDRLSWRRAAKSAAGEELAEVYELIWADGPHNKFVVHLAKLRVRLGAAGVPERMVTEFEEAARECFQNACESREEAAQHGWGDDWGINTTILNRLEAAMTDIQKKLR